MLLPGLLTVPRLLTVPGRATVPMFNWEELLLKRRSSF